MKMNTIRKKVKKRPKRQKVFDKGLSNDMCTNRSTQKEPHGIGR